MGFHAQDRPDFLIVGAGVIGCAIARELARRRAGRVQVIDRADAPGTEASGAAAGVLAVTSSRAPRGAVLRLKRASAELYPALRDELLEETGIDIEYRRSGLVELAFGERDAEQLAEVVRRRTQDGERAEWMDRRDLSECEPGVSEGATAGARFAEDRAVNNGLLVEALRRSAERHGATFDFGMSLQRAERRDARLLSVRAGERTWQPGELIVAAGLGTRQVGESLRAKMPIRPDRGEMIALRPKRLPAHTLVWGDGYLVPRNNGELLIGSTSARGESEKVVSEASVEVLRARAARMFPELADLPIERRWAGIRPMCTLRRPMIGPVRGFENVCVAAGHHRSGILLAPITAQLVADCVLDGQTHIDLAPFKYKKKP